MICNTKHDFVKQQITIVQNIAFEPKAPQIMVSNQTNTRNHVVPTKTQTKHVFHACNRKPWFGTNNHDSEPKEPKISAGSSHGLPRLASACLGLVPRLASACLGLFVC